MISIRELEDWAKDVLPILTDATIALANLKVIKVEEENKNHIINHDFFKVLRMQQRFILMVQLSKIYSNSKNQKKNFIKLCNKLENETLDPEIEYLFEGNHKKLNSVFRSRQDLIDAIVDFKAELKNQEKNIENLIFMRDKVFAHSDSAHSRPKIQYEDLENLTMLACQMYNTLFGKIFDKYFHFITSELDLRYIIKKMK